MFKRTTVKNKLWIMLPLITIAAVGLGYRAVAVAIESRPPTVVVVFNLQQVFDSFVDRAVLSAGYKELETKIDAERLVRKERVDSLIASYEEASDEDRTLLFDEIQQAMGEAEKYIEFTEREKDVEKSLIMQSLFSDINEAVATIAESNNYDLVIASDESVVLDPRLPSRATNEQISMHRIYYANDQIDITEQIITQMNLELDASGN
ncbi:MAG: OmpH family outer membrane protein [Phycisphaerales bacterium]|nr:OmpH family outer membrane protein [Phycisphaerales bacterium]